MVFHKEKSLLKIISAAKVQKLCQVPKISNGFLKILIFSQLFFLFAKSLIFPFSHL
jgi:hypothetical protein